MCEEIHIAFDLYVAFVWCITVSSILKAVYGMSIQLSLHVHVFFPQVMKTCVITVVIKATIADSPRQ